MPTELTLEQLIWVAQQVVAEEYDEVTEDQDELTEQLEDVVGFGLDGLENIIERLMRMGWVRIPQISRSSGCQHPTRDFADGQAICGECGKPAKGWWEE